MKTEIIKDKDQSMAYTLMTLFRNTQKPLVVAQYSFFDKTDEKFTEVIHYYE